MSTTEARKTVYAHTTGLAEREACPLSRDRKLLSSVSTVLQKMAIFHEKKIEAYKKQTNMKNPNTLPRDKAITRTRLRYHQQYETVTNL